MSLSCLADLRVCSKVQVEGSDVQLSLKFTCNEALKVYDSQETKLKALVAFYEPIYTSTTIRLCFGKGDMFQQL